MGTQCTGPPIIGPLDVLGTGPEVYRPDKRLHTGQ